MWCAQSSILVFAKGVYNLVFTWLDSDVNLMLGFTSKFYNIFSAKYHLSWNNVSSNLEVLIISCSILQTMCIIIYFLVDAKQIERLSIRAAIILWENEQCHYTGENMQLLLADPAICSGNAGMSYFDHGIQHYKLFRFYGGIKQDSLNGRLV